MKTIVFWFYNGDRERFCEAWNTYPRLMEEIASINFALGEFCIYVPMEADEEEAKKEVEGLLMQFGFELGKNYEFKERKEEV